MVICIICRREGAIKYENGDIFCPLCDEESKRKSKEQLLEEQIIELNQRLKNVEKKLGIRE